MRIKGCLETSSTEHQMTPSDVVKHSNWLSEGEGIIVGKQKV